MTRSTPRTSALPAGDSARLAALRDNSGIRSQVIQQCTHTSGDEAQRWLVRATSLWSTSATWHPHSSVHDRI